MYNDYIKYNFLSLEQTAEKCPKFSHIAKSKQVLVCYLA